MSQLIANLAIQGAIAAILVAIAALITAVANYFNTRTRMMEQSMQIADLQRQTTHLATVQEVRAASTPPSAPGPTIITLPAPAAAAVPQDSAPAGEGHAPASAAG